MTELELQQYLQREYPQENSRCEWKEFKNLKNSFCGDEKDDVISYVSAIANMDGGHLVIGVKDKTLEIVGTDSYNYDRQKAILRLKERCANLSTEGLDIEEFVTDDTAKKVWVIQIPKHRPKLPVYAHDKAWQRIEDSLVELTQERLNAILEENSPTFDWSAEIVEEATLDNLNTDALAKARSEYKAVHPRVSDEVDGWDDMELLCRAGVANKGKLTRAAILLLGKPTAIHFIRPAVATITWVLVDDHDEKVDYEHFTIPFLLTVDEALSKIRNLNQRILPGGTLFPDIVKQYDEYSIREILHNSIAHQDYHIDQAKKEVTVKIYGKLIDEKYYRLLKANPTLSLDDCIALDFVQKHEQIDKDMATRLKKLHLVEGRYPKLFLSEYVAKTADNDELKTEYIKNRSFNDSHFKDMIVSYLRSFGGATRGELNTLLSSKLSDVLTDEQKIRKVGNLLSALKKDGIIQLSEKKKWNLVEV